MKNWKKLLACMLAGVLALAVFTACTGGTLSVGLKGATAQDAQALCGKLNVTYNQELSSKAHTIANWLASSSVSATADETAFYRAGTASDEVKTDLQQERYASAFEHLGAGVLGADNITVGIQIDCNLDYADNRIEFTVPVDGSVTSAMITAASGKAEMGAAYLVVGQTRYTVTVFR